MSYQLRTDTQNKISTSFLTLLRCFASDRHNFLKSKENSERLYQNRLGFFTDAAVPSILKELLIKAPVLGQLGQLALHCPWWHLQQNSCLCF